MVPAARFGQSAALAGDVDGDGTLDIALGGPSYSAEAQDGGGGTLIPVPR